MSIFSPNYPADYPSDSNLLWKFEAEEGVYLKIEFITFNTEADYDILEVRAGLNIEGVVIPVEEQVSGQIDHRVMYINGITYLHFTSDSSYEYNGFHLEISTLNDSNGIYRHFTLIVYCFKG